MTLKTLLFAVQRKFSAPDAAKQHRPKGCYWLGSRKHPHPSMRFIQQISVRAVPHKLTKQHTLCCRGNGVGNCLATGATTCLPRYLLKVSVCANICKRSQRHGKQKPTLSLAKTTITLQEYLCLSYCYYLIVICSLWLSAGVWPTVC